MKFFKVTHNSEEKLGFAWVGSYGPVKDLWFLHPTFLARKRAFLSINPLPPGLHIDKGGRRWPDFIGCGHSPPSFFISERVVLSLQNIGASFGRVTEMPIAEINAKALKSIPAPRYFVLETFPGIEVDLAATGFKLDASGEAIVDPPPEPWPSRYQYRLDSWNGANLFAYRHLGPTEGPYLELLCTERIKELSEREGWTNLRFVPIGSV